ncbi:exonuclease SbcCD subunit D [Psychrobacillus psychrodurans]|uniref:exonuclease SbcCD subunit D n=1 Tax=Psychrobacillus psychrodurans TaxID=126157 RepID=UPI0008ECDD9B|nr:exonuclease SbcCD subunit D [Psychrobacillus psychrodurans]MCZ8540855.1 exonuclease SbcCD subunit D [Psychrobacillus psychrodurans]SFM77227.1 exonuclease SbcD [Psychrobacillus psychrodurans]
MKFFHTADWHLGKLVQGVYMTNDQRIVLQQFLEAIDIEKPDAVIIAGDLYDRAVPPTEAVHLLDEMFAEIVLKRKTPLLTIAGNHDSPGRLNFGSKLMKETGLHIVGQLSRNMQTIILNDTYGEVHFHLVPYADPSQVRYQLEEETIITHNQAMKKIIESIEETMDKTKRHVFIGHAFVTPHGQEEENTSDSERPLAIGGAEYVDANLFEPFHYTALGHLHQAHYVLNETIRYSGSPLKYSISEEHHKKGFLIVEIDGKGKTTVEKRLLEPTRDMRTVEGFLQDILKQTVSEDYVFVKLLDDTPILSPMEQIRTVYPNAMHVERKSFQLMGLSKEQEVGRTKKDEFTLFRSFYTEVSGKEASEETEQIFKEVLTLLAQEEREGGKIN